MLSWFKKKQHIVEVKKEEPIHNPIPEYFDMHYGTIEYYIDDSTFHTVEIEDGNYDYLQNNFLEKVRFLNTTVFICIPVIKKQSNIKINEPITNWITYPANRITKIEFKYKGKKSVRNKCY